MEKISLIIGAGVNKEIHPDIDLGRELIQNISDRVTDRTTPNGPNLSINLERHFPEFNRMIRTDFLMHLDHYISSVEYPSIDEFLNEVETFPEFEGQRQQFLDIGLLMILAHVIGWEGKKTVDSLTKELTEKRTWLSVLAKYLEDKVSGSDFNIITFNYDRIVEYFLLKTFSNNSKAFVKNHIHHVYGRLANLDGLDPAYDGEQSLGFDVPNHAFTEIAKLKNNIKLIRQKVDTKSIKDIVKNSKRLVLFGYGLDPINNKRIGLHEWDGKDSDFVFNIFFGGLPDFNLQNRRETAEKVRAIRIDADIQFMNCKEFLNYALNEKH